MRDAMLHVVPAGDEAPLGRAMPFPEPGPAAPVEIPAPPARPDTERNWLATLLPALSALGMIAFAVMSPSLLILVLSGSVAVVSVAAGVAAHAYQRRRSLRQWATRSQRYRRRLAGCEQVLADAAARQRLHARAAFPPPESAIHAVKRGSIWQRGSDDQPLDVRLGVGRGRPRRPPQLRFAADVETDPALAADASACAARFGAVDDLPLSTSIGAGETIVLAGRDMPIFRALVVSLTRAHGPDTLRLSALVPPAEARWLGRLPHAECVTSHPDRLRLTNADASTRHVLLLAHDAAATQDALDAVRSHRRSAASALSAVALWPDGVALPAEATAVLVRDDDGGLSLTTLRAVPERSVVARPDAVSFRSATHFADALRHRWDERQEQGRAGPLTLAPLLRMQSPDPLALPIGYDERGQPVYVDLREAASGGDGPHGLVIGCTGSGKSELLRTMLIAAASQAGPEQLALLLIDYKGGAAFADLARLPHTAGLLTNLNGDPQGVDRMCASLHAELTRRQRLLRNAGVDHVDRYVTGRDASPLPRLLIVIDEYAELIEETPEVLDVLTSIARLGRSLGMHLLLASQRLDDGRLRGLDAHLRYRVCLRTMAAAESAAVLGSPAAAHLPAVPGHAYLRRDDSLVRLRVALVDHLHEALKALVPPDVSVPACRARTVLLPPLPERLALSEVASPQRPLKASIGLLDLPALGAQHALAVDLADGGHLAVAGAPRSGRSTLLASTVLALADATPSSQLAIHVIASPASVLAGVGGLPHVGTVAGPTELCRRVLQAVADEVAARQAAGSGHLDGQHILLVIDDVGARLRADEALFAPLLEVASSGLAVGVTLAVSCARWPELRGGLRETFGKCWELRLGDPAESLRPQLARRLPRPMPGRLLTDDGAWAQVALPVPAAAGEADDVQHGLARLVSDIARRGGRATRPIQPLPQTISADALPAPSAAHLVPVGVTGPYIETVELSLAPGEHLIVLGNSGSGKSGLLRLIAATLVRREARVWLIDPRRTNSECAELCHRYAAGHSEILAAVADLVGAYEPSSRQVRPQAPLTAGLASDVVVIDDADLLTGGGLTGPLSPLAELLPRAADVGLSVIAARRASGSSRAAFDPFFGRLLELSETGLLLSGDPAEGPLLAGLRPKPRPPGRADFVRRGELAGEIQLAWFEKNVRFTNIDHQQRRVM